MANDTSRLETALRYPWNDGDSGITLVSGGILTLLSPLLVPAFLVLGYTLRVVESELADAEEPPRFGDWGALFVDGVKAAVVLVAYLLVPMVVAAFVLAAVAGAAGFRFRGGVPTLTDAAAVGGLFLAIVLLLAGLLLVVTYLAPAALIHLARTRRIGAAFAFEDVRELASADSYGSAWLLSLAVFAANAVVLLVLNAAGVGVILSGFLSFYAFVAMAHLYADGARVAGFAVESDRNEEANANG